MTPEPSPVARFYLSLFDRMKHTWLSLRYGPMPHDVRDSGDAFLAALERWLAS